MRTFAFLLLIASSGSALAEVYKMPACASEISSYYGVPVALVGAVRHAEGGKVGQRVGPNRNGSYDLGPMQINTNWFNGTFNIDLRDYDIHEEDVLYNECTNMAVGAWLLRLNYDSVKDWHEAAAAYNAGIKRRKIAYPYADRVFRWWKKLKNHWVPNTQPVLVSANG